MEEDYHYEEDVPSDLDDYEEMVEENLYEDGDEPGISSGREQKIDMGLSFRLFAGDPTSFAKLHHGNATISNVPLSTFIGDYSSLSKTQEKIARISRTDEEVFIDSVLVFAKMLEKSIPKSRVKGLIDMVPRFDKIKYKNPLLMLLAYLCITPDGKINCEVYKDIINNQLAK